MMNMGAKHAAGGKRSGLKGSIANKIGAKKAVDSKHADGGPVALEMQVRGGGGGGGGGRAASRGALPAPHVHVGSP